MDIPSNFHRREADSFDQDKGCYIAGREHFEEILESIAEKVDEEVDLLQQCKRYLPLMDLKASAEEDAESLAVEHKVELAEEHEFSD